MSNTVAKETRWIRPLPERLVNKIAAGEVIERPASVLKELVENSLDSGATRIDVTIEKSGISKIEVNDNGCGISGNQLEIAFSRHATSKITDFNDLEHIRSFGFRGEALPSIASVSRLRMLTKSPAEDSANQIQIEGGVVQDMSPAHRADGTSVVVEDLFFNTPARKKFLKSETTEARQLSRTAIAQALATEGVAFQVRLNGRKLFSYSADDNLLTRVSSALGIANDSLIEFKTEGEGFSVRAALGKPELARSVRGGLYLFINRRALKSSALLSAIYLGYGELLPKGLFPVGAALIEVDSTTVDVNVHPAKSEVRLSDEQSAHRFVRHAVRDALRQQGIIPSATFGQAGTDFPVSHSYSAERAFPNSNRPSDTSQIIAHSQIDSDSSATDQLFGVGSKSVSSPERVGNSSAPSALTPENLDQGVRYLGQFNQLYLLAQSGSDLYLIDQHAAHERILYEQTMAQMQEKTLISQRMLLPVNVELSAERLLICQEKMEELEALGFELSHLGGQTMLINAVPAILSHKSPERTFSLALDDIERLSKAGYSPIKAVAQSIACRSAVMDGDSLDPDEARVIINGLFACQTGYSCPHGRPTFVKISRAELDKKFGRT